jgi:ABC-type bacteriocin/lantibiotic exporter with double-glycine peptidase domain
MKSKIIRDLLRKYYVNIFILLVIAILMVLTSVAAIEVTRRLINVISSPASAAGRRQHDLFAYSLMFLSAILASGVINYILQVRYAKFSQSFVSDIRLKLFNHLLQLPQDFFNKNPIGQITNRIMNEVSSIGAFFARLFLQPVINVIMIIFYTVYIFQLNWKLALAGTIFIPISAMIIPKFNRRINTLTEQSIECNGNLTSHFQEVFSGIGDIRSSQTYNFEESKLKKRILEYFTINMNTAKTAGGLESLMKVITQLAPLSLYFYGGHLCLKGEMPVGTLVAAIAIMNNLYSPVNSIVYFIMEWRQVSIRFDKLDEYLKIEPEKGILPGEALTTFSNGPIRFNKVRFGFDGEQMLLNDISFVTQYGKKAAFVGTSGSGKSLTATLISTIYRPLSGSITFGGEAADSVPLFSLRSKIGYVNQTPFLFNDTIKNNILYALLRKTVGDTDRIDAWVDFALLDEVNDSEMLDLRILEIVKDVGLFDDVFNIGMRSKLITEACSTPPDSDNKIVKARKQLAQAIAGYGGEYVEVYREDRFLEYCTILENIVFIPSAAISQKFGTISDFINKYLSPFLREKGFLERLVIIGLHLAQEDKSLIEKLYKDKSPLLNYLESDKGLIERTVKLNEKLVLEGKTLHAFEKLDASILGDVLTLALSYCPGRSKEDLLSVEMKGRILALRGIAKTYLAEKIGEEIEFYNPEIYMPSLSLMDNIIFGTINPLRKKAVEEINARIRKIVQEAGLEEQVIKLGLEFNVGERGNKLSGGQRQKVSIARVLLMNPSILILDEATAALDASSQALITDLVREKFRDKTVISIAHRLNIVKDYDEILVFDKGSIVQRGNFEKLVAEEGLFKKLYEGSN